ncbi:MAG: segregation/condensation protein A [Clostridia bacterium]|nr:segregation/condensation protein A [Clostridia bacterium]
MKNVLNLESQVYSIKSNDFEGPLDLLCHLIDKNKMDICDINISDITDQYIAYLNKMEELNLEIASEFVIMASTLLYLKSKTLLPSLHDDDEAEEELTEEELLRRIIEYKKYKEISSTLGEMYNNNYKIFFKDEEKIKFDKKQLDENDIDYMLLYDAYRNVIDMNKTRLNKNAKNIKKIAITDNYTVSSKVKEMYRELIRNKKFVFNNLYSQKECNKEEVVTAFTGLLEMSRRSKVQTSQELLFGDITVEKNKRKID